jgi:hypothetical protein
VAWDIQIKQDNNTVKIWKFFAAEIVSVTQDEIDSVWRTVFGDNQILCEGE